MKGLSFLLLFITFSCLSNAQTEDPAPVFVRIASELNDFKPDTSAVPNDKITKKIIQLRELRGGFNINEAIAFKLEEERQKKEKPAAEIEALKAFFTTGNGARWINNAMIWIYRSHFSFKELKQLVHFYKTNAGRKMAADIPVIMLKALKAGEMIKDYPTR